MENVEIARVLNEYADLLEIQGENTFRIRSYRQAAKTIEGLSQPVAQLAADEKELQTLPGIGTRMVEHLKEILKTGTLTALKATQEKVPATLTELMQLEGLGPKRAKKLYETLGIASVADLGKAIKGHKVAELPGFGEKTVRKLREAIDRFGKYSERFRLAEVDQLVRPVVEYLRQAPGISNLEVAGSYRRRKETVGDVDILITCRKQAAVMNRFRDYPEASRVDMAGTTRGTIVLQSGLQVDLRVVPGESYGSALVYFTGSKDHNIALRKLALESGLSISEYGVFRLPKGKRRKTSGNVEGKRIAGRSEKEVYRAVKMAWIPPELREDRGEIQAAREDRLPSLVTPDAIRGDLHMHSKWTDGNNTIEEMVRACRERGYEYCAITDHSKETRVAGGLNAEQFRRQWEEIEKVRERFDDLAVLAGVELDILADGTLDFPDDFLAHFDIVIASVHTRLKMKRQEMTRRIVKALSNPAVDVLGHPTGREINRREPYDVDLEEILEAAKENRVAVELDSHPERLDLNDVHLHRARELGLKVAINSDAHTTDQLRFVSYGVDQARRGWLEEGDVLNAMAWSELKKWLNRKGRG
jgi:DNA polymerase (family 10)